MSAPASSAPLLGSSKISLKSNVDNADNSLSTQTPMTNSSSSSKSNLTMQIVLRRDLITNLGWPVGPLMAQASHAATAVMHLYSDHPDVIAYTRGDNWKSMRKVVMEVPNEEKMRELVAKLDTLEPRIPYHLWIEEPESLPTALALVPNKRPKPLKRILDGVGCELWK